MQGDISNAEQRVRIEGGMNTEQGWEEQHWNCEEIRTG